MVELYINEELIDLSVDQALAMTYQVNDIGDIKNMRANFSNQFKIPKTKENCRKLGFIDQITSSDMRPYRALPARIIQDGEEIVRNGVCQVLSVDQTINVVIYSGIKDFFETLGDAKLSDLDLSDLDHTWDEATINALRGSTSGICYPFIDYGPGFQSQYQFFAIYVKTLFERIFQAAGFEYYGSFLDHPAFDKLILPFSNDKYLAPEEATHSSFVATGQPMAIGSCNSNYHTVGQPTGVPGCPTIDGLPNITGNENGLFDGSKFTVGASPLRGVIKLKGTGNTGGVVNTFWVRVVSSVKGVLWRFKSNPLGGNVQRFSVDIPKADYQPGEQIYIDIASLGQNVLLDLHFEFAAQEEVVFGFPVDVSRNMPDITQKDFLKGIAHMYGVIFEQDENIQRVRLRQFDEIQTNKGASIDWSEKLDRRESQLIFDIGYAQVNNFRYKKDDGVPESYGDGVLMVDNDNLSPEKTVIELPFAATVDAEIRQFEQKEGDDLVLSVEEYNPATQYSLNKAVMYQGSVFRYINQSPATGRTPRFDGSPNPLTEDEMSNNLETHWRRMAIDALLQYERTIATEPRIMIAEKVGSDIFPYFIKPGGEWNLGFADSLLENNYKTIADITQKTKMVKAYFNLTGNDVKNIDYLIPRYVSRFGAFFYINRIEKFMKGKATLVHLLRV